VIRSGTGRVANAQATFGLAAPAVTPTRVRTTGNLNGVQLLLTDETNVEPSSTVKFFVTGGLFFSIDKLPGLHRGVAQIRRRYNFGSRDVLKFSTRERPRHVTAEDFAAAKDAVITLCQNLGCRFIAYVILHRLINRSTKIEWALDAVLRSFDHYLREHAEPGIVIFDRPPVASPNGYMAARFCDGLQFRNGRVKLDRIQLLGMTCANASHASSAMDIVLGAFRYAINDRRRTPICTALMQKVVPLMWGDRDGERLRILERGLVLRPLRSHIRVEAYRAEYEKLVNHINALIA
jgi:hypothetical protein